MKVTKFLFFVALCFVSSCAAPKIAYLQDMKSGEEGIVANVQDIKIRPEDKISILVNSKDPMLTNLFNLPYVTRQLGQIAGQTYTRPGA